MATNRDRAQRWIDRALGDTDRDLGTNGTVFYEGDTIYSYGRHFSMAEIMRDKHGRPEWILVNGDRYSVTTSGHQGMVRGVIAKSGLPSVIIPFSALAGAEILPDSIRLIEVRPDRFTKTEHESETPPGDQHARMEDPSGRLTATFSLRQASHGFGRTARLAPPWVADPDAVYVANAVARRGADGIWRWTVRRHWLGDSLFSARVRGQRGRRTFLSSFDYQEAQPLYFLCELPRGADAWSVEQAYEALKPPLVVSAEIAGLEVSRQGDVFAVPTSLTTREVKRQTPYGKGRIVKRPAVLGTNHEPSEAMFATGDRVYARGTLYHAPDGWREPDHSRRRMGDGRTWHLLTRNTVPRSRPVQTPTR